MPVGDLNPNSHSITVDEAVTNLFEPLFSNLLCGTMARYRGIQLKSQLHGRLRQEDPLGPRVLDKHG